MLSKNYIKHLSSLKEKKYRDTKQEYLVEGSRSVKEFLLYPHNIKALFALTEWCNENAYLLDKIRVINEIPYSELLKISSLKTPNQVIALIAKQPENITIEYDNIILALDGIRDPGNVGTIIRIADWYGIDFVICSPDTADPYNPKAVQASMGSLCRVNVVKMPLENFLKNVPNDFTVYGTYIDSEPINNINKTNKAVIIIGNEARGISDETSKYVAKKISIQAYPHKLSVVGAADSLNAAIATSILCYEFKK